MKIAYSALFHLGCSYGNYTDFGAVFSRRQMVFFFGWVATDRLLSTQGRHSGRASAPKLAAAVRREIDVRRR